MGGRVLSVLAVAAVVAVAAAAAVDSLRGDGPPLAEPSAPAAAAAEPRDCIDSAPCLRGLRELVAFYRACVRTWNEPANRANQAIVVAGGFDRATLFRSRGDRCSLYLVSEARARVLVARRIDGRWTAVGGGRRPPAADDFDDAWSPRVRPDGTLSLRAG